MRRGAVVKRFTVRESDTIGLLVRLKAEHLDCNGNIHSEILSSLRPLSELALELRGLRVSDEGLKALLTQLRPVGLDVSGSEISDCGLRVLTNGCSQLRLLDLSFTRVGDSGLPVVACLPELRHVSLIGCRVTDSSIASLACLGNLRELYLTKTAVSTQAAQQLRKTLPDCRIER